MTTGSLAIFEANRGRMFGIAYRMLGSAVDAEDVLQDAWLRWNSTDADAVAEPSAYLATIVTRLCLTALDSARARREVYVGPWLPEPVDTSADPLLGAETNEALSLAVLLLLERLSPAERAAYVLHEAFAYPYARIAEVLETSDANARQLASRARNHLSRNTETVATPADRARLMEALVAAAQRGDLAALELVFTADVSATSDGGGVVLAARKVSQGRDRVGTFVLGVLSKFGQGLVSRVVEANGQPAVLAERDGVPIALWSVDAAASGVRALYIVLNPDKLRAFGLSRF